MVSAVVRRWEADRLSAGDVGHGGIFEATDVALFILNSLDYLLERVELWFDIRVLFVHRDEMVDQFVDARDGNARETCQRD